jgi:hypothetical protein
MRNVKSVTFALLVGSCLWLGATAPLHAAGAAAQQRAAEEFLGALARGDAQALSMSILDSELAELRKGLLDQMKLEADRDESLTRQRLFGEGMLLSDIERLTPQNFFVALSQRLRFGGREFRKVDWMEEVKDRGGMVHLVGRLVPPEDMGDIRVPVLVTLVPWGRTGRRHCHWTCRRRSTTCAPAARARRSLPRWWPGYPQPARPAARPRLSSWLRNPS